MAQLYDEIVQEDTQKGKYLTFFIDGAIYGIEIKYIVEIISLMPITEIPEAPSYVRGIINLRGKILPVIDVRLKFKKKLLEYTERTCIIVVNMHEYMVGLIVDGVDEVLYIPDENIVPPPEFKTRYQNRYVKGIGKVEDKVKLLLDCDRILNEDEFEELSQIDKNIKEADKK